MNMKELIAAVPENMQMFTRALNKLEGVSATNIGTGRYHLRVNGTYHIIVAKTQEEAIRELSILDDSDYLEREAAELDLHTQLEHLNNVVAQAKQQAKHLIAQLPVPKSATVRKDPKYWTNPTSATRSKFPQLW